MNDESGQKEFEQWYPTYGVLTAERILGQFNIALDNQSLINAVKNPKSIYQQLLKVPIKNLFSGIIMDQAVEYQCFAQKLIVDYLISGQADAPEDSPGASIREKLEEERLNLKELNEALDAAQLARRKLIAESQSKFIGHAHSLGTLLSTMAESIKKNHELDESTAGIENIIRGILAAYKEDLAQIQSSEASFWNILCEALAISRNEPLPQNLSGSFESLNHLMTQIQKDTSEYIEPSHDIMVRMRNIRSEFYELILRIKEQISLLPEYRDGEARAQKNMESLTFDPLIGEDK